MLILLGVLLLAGWRILAPSTAPSLPTRVATPAPATATPAPTEIIAATVSPTPAPILTATPSPSRTPSPSLTPSPSPTPAPTAATPSQLAQARQKLRDGDYPGAISDFNGFLAANPNYSQANKARFALAQAWLAAGNPQQALPILEMLAGEADALADQPEILYWLGRAYRDVDAQKSAAAFLRYASHSQYLKADAYLAAADAFLANQDASAAADAYARALDAATDLHAALRAREGLANAALMLTNPAEAISQYQVILAQAMSPGYRTEILYRLGQAQQAAGDAEAAWRSYQQAIHEDAASWYAYQALIQLVDAEQPVDARLRAEIDLRAGAYLPAVAILSQLLDETPADASTLWIQLARAYEGLGNDAAAAAAWRQALANHPDADAQDQAWLGLARSLRRQGQTEAAREVYLQAAEQSRDPDTAASALWSAAVLAGQDQAKWLQAVDDFMRLARSFPATDFADQAGFRAGLIHYRLGNYETAQALWAEHAAGSDSQWRAAAHYWLGKLLRQTGQEAQALAHWRETARRWDEANFYGVRARQMLQEAGVAPTPTPAAKSGDTLDEAMVWAAALAGKDASAFLQTPPEFARIAELHRVGDVLAGHSELESWRRAWQDDPVKLLQLALFARDLGYYDQSIRAASQLVTLSGRPLTEAPLYVQKLIYPRYYQETMASVAETFGLDLALYNGLIRQESLFWAPAASSAGARGLAQIMPATGQAAAQQTHLEAFTLSDLTRPHISLYLGAYILSEELRRSDGAVFRALAAYNAGPGNAAFWWQLAKSDPDLFVELISFRETQRYVRTIVTQAAQYRRLYPHLRKP